MRSKSPLSEYRGKRDLKRSGEPRGGRRRTRGEPRFVVQKHDATSLHYDFRVEVEGVLKSWAVPKGPSTSPKDKRLAMATEDHPLEYGDFEGVIPEGEYGAGSVIVWDTGTYCNLADEPPEQQVARGHLSIWLDGEKLHGGYVLQRMARGKKERWLLVKIQDEGADARRNPVSTQPESVLSGRTVEEVGKKTTAARTKRKRAAAPQKSQKAGKSGARRKTARGGKQSAKGRTPTHD